MPWQNGLLANRTLLYFLLVDLLGYPGPCAGREKLDYSITR